MCSADQHLGDAGSWTAPPVGLQTRGGGIVYDANAFVVRSQEGSSSRGGAHSMTGARYKQRLVEFGGVSRVCDPVRCVPGRHVQDPRYFSLKDAGLVQFHLTCCFPILGKGHPPRYMLDTRAPPCKRRLGHGPGPPRTWDGAQTGSLPCAAPLHRLSIVLRHPWGSKALGSRLESRASCWAQDRSLGKDSGSGSPGNPGWAAVT